MSGPSATMKPISPKIAMSSSVTWLTGWTRPSGDGPHRQGHIEGLAAQPGIERGRSNAVLRSAIAATTASLSWL